MPVSFFNTPEEEELQQQPGLYQQLAKSPSTSPELRALIEKRQAAAPAAPAPAVDPYSNEARQKLIEENSGYDTKGAITGALASLAAGFQGGDSMGAVNQVMNQRAAQRKGAVEDFDKGLEAKNKAELTDPNSERSVAFRKTMEANFPRIAQAYGDSWSRVSAADQDSIFKPLQLKEQTDARKESAALLAGQRADAREDRKLQRDLMNNEKQQKLQTPFGLANSEDDAKKLKDAFELKSAFDNKLKQMIALREGHNGGAILDREAVQRGKQLSKDLLLEYKNLQKLGVLSQSDEAIINAIIPEDPLAYNSPLAAIQGQDPILSRLKSFQSDSDKDFQTRIGTRTRAGIGNVANRMDDTMPPPGKVEMISPDGKRKLVDPKDVPAAIAAGGKQVKGGKVAGGM